MYLLIIYSLLLTTFSYTYIHTYITCRNASLLPATTENISPTYGRNARVDQSVLRHCGLPIGPFLALLSAKSRLNSSKALIYVHCWTVERHWNNSSLPESPH